MPRGIFLIFFWASLLAIHVQAVEMNGGYDATSPTNSDIPNWVTIGNTGVSGWGSSGITGWNYVGQIGSTSNPSGVYLGNGWVLTAGHVGFGNFILAGTTYTAISGSGRLVTPDNANGNSEDLYVFQISNPPALPGLTLSTSLPIAFPATQTPSTVAMLGFGGGHGLTWGLDTVTEVDQTIDLTQGTSPLPFISNDFLTDNGTNTYSNSNGTSHITITNNSTVVGGDSGGGDFTFNSTTKKWELMGINEVTGTYSNSTVTFSGMVQLDIYAAQINAIVNPPVATDTPTMPLPALLIMACLLFWAASRSLRASSARR